MKTQTTQTPQKIAGLGLALLLSLAAPAEGQEHRHESSDEAAVLAVVDALFDGMRAKDAEAMAALFHPEARLNSTEVRDGGTVVGSVPIDGFIRSVAASESYLDEVTWDEEVRVEGPLAQLWTPYALFVDESFSHCGVDAFHLARMADGWKILQITETRQREGGPEVPGR